MSYMPSVRSLPEFLHQPRPRLRRKRHDNAHADEYTYRNAYRDSHEYPDKYPNHYPDLCADGDVGGGGRVNVFRRPSLRDVVRGCDAHSDQDADTDADADADSSAYGGVGWNGRVNILRL